MIVTLAWSEVQTVAAVGVSRRIAALRKGRTEPHGIPQSANGDGLDTWGMDIESCAAEYAVAKATGNFWSAEICASLVETPPDVGARIQVRSSPHASAHLIVYDKDSEDDAFVLVTGTIPTFTIRGWLPGVLAKQPTFWKQTPRGTMAYWISQTQLLPINDFHLAAA